jgi:hypothetical protein
MANGQWPMGYGLWVAKAICWCGFPILTHHPSPITHHPGRSTDWQIVQCSGRGMPKTMGLGNVRSHVLYECIESSRVALCLPSPVSRIPSPVSRLPSTDVPHHQLTRSRTVSAFPGALALSPLSPLSPPLAPFAPFGTDERGVPGRPRTDSSNQHQHQHEYQYQYQWGKAGALEPTGCRDQRVDAMGTGSDSNGLFGMSCPPCRSDLAVPACLRACAA